jgi:EAL domain-containing protein (putative c-di-GMP-specific phosphodiesterase class I)
LKIDKSFVDDIVSDENDRNIVRSIITLGHNLHLKIVAEGVEQQTQLDFLKDNGCDIIQGYFYSKPLAATAVVEFLENRVSN